MNKKEKITRWKRRKNAPVICEDTQDGLTFNIAVRGILTVCDGKADSEWDNVPSGMEGNQTVERLSRNEGGTK